MTPIMPRDRRDRARPLVINGCFGWLHIEREDVGSDVAILLCPPLSWDALHAHHALRRLADAFAADGYPTLRIAYPGTGDSADVDAQDAAPAEQWSSWQCCLHEAADWLRASTGARRLILVGLRIGATLATLVAERRDDVAGLVLLAPVLRGKSYIRQLCMEAQLETGVAIKPEEGLEFHELRLSAETVRRISGVDLQTVRIGAPLVAIFQQGTSRLVDGCVAAWAREGADIGCTGFDGLEPMLQQTIHGDTVSADLRPVTDWVRRAIPASARPLPPAPLTPCLGVAPTTYSETPMCFGDEARLFGILCRPWQSSRAPAGDLVVLIGNTGRDPHYGVARFGVEFARRLAAQGIASFRLDFAGLGDSIGHAGQEDVLSPLFEVDRAPDISAAIDALQGVGYRRFAMHGLCSGAYHAFHGAVADGRIEALMLVNFPMFFWEAGESVEDAARKLTRPRDYLAKFGRADLWLGLLKDKRHLARILRAQATRLGGRLQHRSLATIERLGLMAPASPPRRAMATLSRRGVRTLFLFGPVDPGIDAVEQAFGRNGHELAKFDAGLRIVPGVDHLLSGRQMRRTIAALMIDFIVEAFNLSDDHRRETEPAERRPPVLALTG